MYGNDERSLRIWYDQAHASSLTGFPGSADESTLLFDNNVESPYAKSGCNELDHGISTHGFYNLMYIYSRLAYDVAAAAESLPAGQSSIRMQTYDPNLELNMMAYDCIPEALTKYRDFHETPILNVHNLVNGYLHITCTVILVLCMAAFYWAVFKPLMISVEREVALTPSMLLMLPPNVLMKVESIRVFTASANTA